MPKPVQWTYLTLKWLHVSPAGKEGRPGSARFCDCVANSAGQQWSFRLLTSLLHYVLFLLRSHPKDAAGIGHELNQFERRQLIEWRPKKEDFLKHDDEHRTYDDVFGPYRSETDNYSTCVFPRLPFTHRYASDYLLLKLKDGMRLLDLGCGSRHCRRVFWPPAERRHHLRNEFFYPGGDLSRQIPEIRRPAPRRRCRFRRSQLTRCKL